MDILAQGYRYWSVKVQDDRDGFIGVKVFRELKSEQIEAATVIYWDATGEIAVTMQAKEMPIEAIEAAAEEVRGLAGLKTRGSK